MDAVVVGSGPNGLAAALTLAAEGASVRVIEAEHTIGGGTRTGELTVPGLVHDHCSAFHPLAVDTPLSRRFDLGGHGLEWCWSDIEYAHPLDGGAGSAAHRDLGLTANALGPDGIAWGATFSGIVDRFDTIADEFTRPMLRVPGHPVHLARFGLQAGRPVAGVAQRLRTEEGRALWAGVAAHAFRPFRAPMSAAVGVALAAAAHRYGWPTARGGSASITTAMASALTGLGGTIETGRRVLDVRELGEPDLVLLDVAPRAAVEIVGDALPGRVRRALSRYRHGPAIFKVDFAVQGGIPWTYEPARSAGTVHVGGTYKEIAAAERDVAAGRMPERPFILVGQQYLADPSRSVDDLHPIWAYAHVPSGWDGDATAAIEAQLERFAPGFQDRVVARHVVDVAGMEAHNANYVGGDVVTGANTPRQLIARPRLARDPYWLGTGGLYLCSAATPPGAGAHGMCGFNAATAALARVRR